MCDCVIEVTGRQQPLELASQLVRIRGRLVIAGYHQDGLRQVNMQQWNWRGLDVINAHERDPRVYAEGLRASLELLKARAFEPSSLYTSHLPLEQLGEAMRLAATRPEGFTKAIVYTSAGAENCKNVRRGL